MGLFQILRNETVKFALSPLAKMSIKRLNVKTV